MIAQILVVAKTLDYGEAVQQLLTGTGRFDVHCVDSAARALKVIRLVLPKGFILDVAVDDLPPAEWIMNLKKTCPRAAFLLLAEENAANRELEEKIAPDAILYQPFHLTDILGKIEGVLQLSRPASKPLEEAPQPGLRVIRSGSVPEWLQDVNRAAQYLALLSMESSAHAALIISGGQLWAYAGQLSQPAVQELAGLVATQWAQRQGAPPGLSSSKRPGQGAPAKTDLARYTHLFTTGDEYMIYATALGEKMILALAFDVQTPFSMIRMQATQLARALSSAPDAGRNLPQAKKESAPAMEEQGQEFEADAETGGPAVSLPIFLDNVPPAMPQGRPGPYPAPADTTLSPQPQAETAVDEPATLPEVGPTRPSTLEPVSPALSDLVYACILVPRLPEHHLTGDLAERLGHWLPQLCLAFGWRLEQISIRPEHLQYLIRVMPNTSPGYLMRIIRQHTSQRIFAEFVALARDNPSGDFWAPGYLIMSSHTPPSGDVVREFIQSIRARQGFSNNILPKINR